MKPLIQKIWLIPCLLCLLIVPDSADAKLTGDHIATNKGDLIIQPILHGTMAMEWNGKIIFIDPYGGADAFKGLPQPDLILITDIHGDHHHPETLAAINTSKAKFIVPAAVAEKLPEDYGNRVTILANGKKTSLMDITIEAIPMYNLPVSSDARHTKGRGNGYVLTLGGKRVYISGDTEDIPEMRQLKNIDVAFVCMNLPYTMNIEQAASAVLAFKPKIMYPFHYRGSDVEAFKKLVSKDARIEVRLREWYP